MVVMLLAEHLFIADEQQHCQHKHNVNRTLAAEQHVLVRLYCIIDSYCVLLYIIIIIICSRELRSQWLNKKPSCR